MLVVLDTPSGLSDQLEPARRVPTLLCGYGTAQEHFEMPAYYDGAATSSGANAYVVSVELKVPSDRAVIGKG